MPNSPARILDPGFRAWDLVMMARKPLCYLPLKLPPSPSLPSCHFPAPEFKQKEECTMRGRSLIQISIQEDPWNLPNSIKTLVDNIQRYVEG